MHGKVQGTDVGFATIPGFLWRVVVLKSSDSGLPQTRTRIYFLGLRCDCGDEATLDTQQSLAFLNVL